MNISSLAGHAIELVGRRKLVGDQLAVLAEAHPDYELLVSIPGMGPKTAVRFVAEIGDITKFPSGGHLASYAGLAPVNRQSGTGLNSVRKDRAGNHRLKNALFLSAFVAARFEPAAKRHYDRQRANGKRHNAAVVGVARKRCDLIWSMLTHRTMYVSPVEIVAVAA